MRLRRLRAAARSAFDGGAGSIATRAGFDLVRRDPGGFPPIPPDCDRRTAEIIRRCRPYSLTSPERMIGLCEAVRYVIRAGIPGAIVECGVWRGGSMMAAAMVLVDLEAADRDIYMFDTFESVPPPDERDEWDIEAFEKAAADPVFALLPAEDVRELVAGTAHPAERLHIEKGLVEETIPARAPPQIALCRLDTDWYRSTAHEMEHLMPRIAAGGVLIVDDYGEFAGARRAVDEYLESTGPPLLLNRLDASGRMAVMPSGPTPTR